MQYLDEWIAALRSGAYRQGYDSLKKEKNGVCEYCANGVLIEIAGLFDPEPRQDNSYLVNGDRCYPRLQTRLELGLHITVMDAIIELNDSRKRSFLQIASWLERNREGILEKSRELQENGHEMWFSAGGRET